MASRKTKGQTSKRRVLPTCIDEMGLPSDEKDVLMQPLGVGERQQPESEPGEESEQEGAVKDTSMAQPKDLVGMADVLSLFERRDTRRREDEARRYEEERTREERRQREFQQLLTFIMEHQTAANTRERQALEELKKQLRIA